jgi:hypothetical protein
MRPVSSPHTVYIYSFQTIDIQCMKLPSQSGMDPYTQLNLSDMACSASSNRLYNDFAC